MVNRALVNHYWPKENPIGKRIRFGSPDYIKVVGVMPDVLPPPLPGQNVRDLGFFKIAFFMPPGPSGLPNACAP